MISEDEGQDYFTGDNVQLAIGQGLLSASPLQLAVGYSTIANYGFVMKPEIIMAIYQPGVPDAHASGYADLSQARLAEDPNVDGEVIRQIPMPPEIRDEIINGLHRVIYGPGTDERPATTARPARTSSTSTRRATSRSPARPAPPRARATIRGTTRRRSPRSAPTRPARTRSPPTSRRPDTVRRPPGLWSSACSCRCPATLTPTRSCCPTSSTRRRTSPPNRGSLADTSCFDGRFGATTRSRVSGMATSFLSRKPDSGLGNIGASPGDPSRNIDWVLMSAQVGAHHHRHASSSSRRRGPASPPTRTRSSPVRSSSRSSR